MDEETPTMEIRLCPKCNNPMKWVQPYHIVPQLPPEAVITGKGPAISFSAGYPVEVWACQTCRYVEMYAAGRKGTAE
jgi:ssDNA-binding Zn-finger/Zn-ribbon topoisomerase 1